VLAVQILPTVLEEQSLSAKQPTHTLALHFGVVPLQSPSSEHYTHVLELGSHEGLVASAIQSLLFTHTTQRELSRSHTSPAKIPTQSSLDVQGEQVLLSHFGVA